MDADLSLKIVTLLRLVAFMLIVYLAFGLVVERFSTKPDSQLRAFARTVCSPVTRPVQRFLAPGADQRRLLLLGMGVVGVLWGITVVAARVLRPG
jgi:uncharacterized BrkB/YihY/UPF0761 family membrane protein